MRPTRLQIDLRHAKNALFVQQTVAVAFGLKLDREFTWDGLTSLVCGLEDAELPAKILVHGITGLDIRVPGEDRKLSAFFDALRARRPDIEILIRIL